MMDPLISITSVKLVREPISQMVREKSTQDIEQSFNSPEKVVQLVNDFFQLNAMPKEYCIGVFLDTKSKLTGLDILSIGGLTASIVEMRSIFRTAILTNAAQFVLLHNHPSGDVKASNEDIEVTNKLAQAAQIMGVMFVDHIIIGNNTYLSMRESNNLITR